MEEDVVDWLHMGDNQVVEERDDGSFGLVQTEAPIGAPPKVHGPKFILEEGQLAITLPDDQDIDLARLEKIIPLLREQVQLAQTHLVGKNSHPDLARNLDRYSVLIEPAPAEIDYETLTIIGVMLNNAEKASSRAVERLLPALEDEAQAALSSVLDVHSLAIMATETGRELLATERDYQRTPVESAKFQEAAKSFSAALRHHNLTTPQAQDIISQTTDEIGKGPNEQRSNVAADRVLMKVGITLLAGGVAISTIPALIPTLGWAATLIVAEGIKKSKLGQSAAEIVKDALDDPRQKQNLTKVRDFVRGKESLFRVLAGERAEFAWFHKALNFITGGPGHLHSDLEAIIFESKLCDEYMRVVPPAIIENLQDYITRPLAAPLAFSIENVSQTKAAGMWNFAGVLLDKMPTESELAPIIGAFPSDQNNPQRSIILLLFRRFVQMPRRLPLHLQAHMRSGRAVFFEIGHLHTAEEKSPLIRLEKLNGLNLLSSS